MTTTNFQCCCCRWNGVGINVMTLSIGLSHILKKEVKWGTTAAECFVILFHGPVGDEYLITGVTRS